MTRFSQEKVLCRTSFQPVLIAGDLLIFTVSVSPPRICTQLRRTSVLTQLDFTDQLKCTGRLFSSSTTFTSIKREAESCRH